jgi:hypothetical protein
MQEVKKNIAYLMDIVYKEFILFVDNEEYKKDPFDILAMVVTNVFNRFIEVQDIHIINMISYIDRCRDSININDTLKWGYIFAVSILNNPDYSEFIIYGEESLIYYDTYDLSEQLRYFPSAECTRICRCMDPNSRFPPLHIIFNKNNWLCSINETDCTCGNVICTTRYPGNCKETNICYHGQIGERCEFVSNLISMVDITDLCTRHSTKNEVYHTICNKTHIFDMNIKDVHWVITRRIHGKICKYGIYCENNSCISKFWHESSPMMMLDWGSKIKSCGLILQYLIQFLNWYANERMKNWIKIIRESNYKEMDLNLSYAICEIRDSKIPIFDKALLAHLIYLQKLMYVAHYNTKNNIMLFMKRLFRSFCIYDKKCKFLMCITRCNRIHLCNDKPEKVWTYESFNQRKYDALIRLIRMEINEFGYLYSQLEKDLIWRYT